MPLELAVWRIDGELRAVGASGLDLEERLETLLDQDVTIANPGWMIIGRQVDTGFGGRVDLLAMDAVGDLAVLELKRDQTPREVIAQVLEYGSWVVKLTGAELAPIYRKYVERYHPLGHGEGDQRAKSGRHSRHLVDPCERKHTQVGGRRGTYPPENQSAGECWRAPRARIQTRSIRAIRGISKDPRATQVGFESREVRRREIMQGCHMGSCQYWRDPVSFGRSL